MRKSILYFLIALTVLSISLSAFPNVRSAPADIKIVGYNYYIDTSGYVDIVGEIQNTGTSVISSVELGGAISTDSGPQTATCLAFCNYLLPGQRAPFYMELYLQSNVGQGSSPTTQAIVPSVYGVTLSVVRADATTGYQYQDVKVTQQTQFINTTAESNGAYMVSGTLKNEGSQTAENVRILGTFYNSSGYVVAVGGYTAMDPLATSLAPSATVDFDFGAFDVNMSDVTAQYKISSYSLLIQVTDPILQGTVPQVTPYPNNPTTVTANPSDTTQPTSTAPSDTQTPDQGTSNSNSTGYTPPTWAYAVVVVIAVAAVIGAVMALRKRRSNEEPKPTKKAAKKT